MSRRSGKNGTNYIISTRRIARSIGFSTMSKDLNDQSYQTTFRTEIYTSEEDGEADNYYAFISNYKKEELQDLKNPLMGMRRKETTFFEEVKTSPILVKSNDRVKENERRIPSRKTSSDKN